MTRLSYLQSLADSLRTPDQYEFTIEFRGRGGWWAIPLEARWFHDTGEYLGQNWREAAATLQRILG